MKLNYRNIKVAGFDPKIHDAKILQNAINWLTDQNFNDIMIEYADDKVNFIKIKISKAN